MAEIIENKMDHHEIPSMAKANAGLTLGKPIRLSINPLNCWNNLYGQSAAKHF